MAAVSSVRITGNITGTPTGSKQFDITLTGAAYATQSLVLQSGANTITVPTSPAPSGCIIKLPSTNTAVVTLKGVSGDTGIAIGKTTTQVINWDSTAVPATFVLNSASTQTGLYTQIDFF